MAGPQAEGREVAMLQDPLQGLFDSQGPTSAKDLEDSAFLRHISIMPGVFDDKGCVIPESQDYEPRASAPTVQRRANQYRRAQARRLIRLWREWKAQQS
jgi:hypothetical protein